MKKVTIRDVAREAGVSVTLVSFVMNAKMGKDGRLDCPVNPDTAERVLQVAKRLGYRRNNAAASLRSGRSHSIAVIVSDIANPFYAEICRNIENIAYKDGYTVIFASSEESPQKLSHLVETMVGYNVEGLIVAPCLGGEPALARALSIGIPTVLIDRDMPGEEFGRVLIDNVDAGKMATKYLIHQGFGKIEMLTYKSGVTSLTDRETGYGLAMEEAGLKDEIRIHKIDYEAEAAKKDAIDVFRDAARRGVEAFILPTKRIAMYGFNALNVLGLSMPKDFSFVCFDESDVYELNKPVVPHIIQPLSEIAFKSFELLQKMIDNKVTEEEKTSLLNVKLVLGGRFGGESTQASF
ncbi:MAG: LacI family transcriptional regulator [Alistipes sp.]|jgi:LacI family transcriptional regulator|nr:LacI family transcriptional regulator [Alistipes sp.]MDD7711005.1 LacI family DNA-binding transcriptional regulator [Alistipes sp.]CDD19917.1 transcriptional regulator LacI family [Alistipes sp. CAG:435]